MRSRPPVSLPTVPPPTEGAPARIAPRTQMRTARRTRSRVSSDMGSPSPGRRREGRSRGPGVGVCTGWFPDGCSVRIVIILRSAARAGTTQPPVPTATATSGRRLLLTVYGGLGETTCKQTGNLTEFFCEESSPAPHRCSQADRPSGIDRGRRDGATRDTGMRKHSLDSDGEWIGLEAPHRASRRTSQPPNRLKRCVTRMQDEGIGKGRRPGAQLGRGHPCDGMPEARP